MVGQLGADAIKRMDYNIKTDIARVKSLVQSVYKASRDAASALDKRRQEDMQSFAKVEVDRNREEKMKQAAQDKLMPKVSKEVEKSGVPVWFSYSSEDGARPSQQLQRSRVLRRCRTRSASSSIT
jgi:L-lactate utilization protein LutB